MNPKFKPWTKYSAAPPCRDGILYPPPAAVLFDYSFPKRKCKDHE
jgi:hypothetical protein